MSEDNLGENSINASQRSQESVPFFVIERRPGVQSSQFAKIDPMSNLT